MFVLIELITWIFYFKTIEKPGMERMTRSDEQLPLENVFTFGGAKRSGSDRECKYFPIGMNAREPLWR